MPSFQTCGFAIFDHDDRVARWAAAALPHALAAARDPAQQRDWLRHGGTWFVGVDALPNDPQGGVDGQPLCGVWQDEVSSVSHWHKAQISVVYPGYPQQDRDESDAAHRFRIRRHAAHVDGLHAVGDTKRRLLLEPHRFVLGLPLNDSPAAPLMLWPGSHQIIGPAMARAYRAAAGSATSQIDLTEAYQQAREEVFARIEPVPARLVPGQSVVLHRHLVHGISPWDADLENAGDSRVMAYFRPEFDHAPDWFAVP